MAVRIVVHQKAVAEILKSKRVQDDLKRRAENIGREARINSGPGADFETAVDVGRTRARSAVFTANVEAMLAEAQDRTLTRALDAGRR